MMCAELPRPTILRRALVAACFLASLGQEAHADGVGPRFCIVPVRDGAATAADLYQPWRITEFSSRIPGLHSLVFLAPNRGGQWTIDASRRLVPYVGPFPSVTFDRTDWVREPWSLRVVGITFGVPLSGGGGVSVLTPGAGRFEKIDPRPFDGVYTLPRRKLTVVTSRTEGPLIVGDRKVTPWLSPEQMAAHDVRGIYSVHDAPSLNATIVVDQDRHVYVLTDDDRWQRVGRLDKNDRGPVFDAPGSQGALLAGNYSVMFIRKQSDGKHFSAATLDWGRAYGASFPFKESRLFGQILTYADGGLFGGRGWRRLTARGFQSIPGSDIGLPRPDLFPDGQIQDLTAIGRTLIEGRDGFFLYDGQKLTAVSGGERGAIGDLPRAHDLPSIGRVVVTTQNGMFELTRDGRLVRMSTPFPADGLPLPELADWPDSGVAVVSARSGMFTLDSDLVAKPIPGGDKVGFGWHTFTGINPESGEMVLTGSHALFLAIDLQRSHEAACPQPD